MEGGPLPGTLAFTARLMASVYPEFDWDAWKDEQKDRELEEWARDK